MRRRVNTVFAVKRERRRERAARVQCLQRLVDSNVPMRLRTASFVQFDFRRYTRITLCIYICIYVREFEHGRVQASKEARSARTSDPRLGIACATARAHTGYERMNFSVLGMLMK